MPQADARSPPPSPPASPAPRAIAERYGAQTLPLDGGLPDDVDRRFDVTVDAGGAGPEGLTWVLGHTGRGGICTSRGARRRPRLIFTPEPAEARPGPAARA